jgi:hypothetical protein
MKGMYGWGLVTGFGLGCLYFLSTALIQSPQEGVEPPRFGVVDTYKGCDVVAWRNQTSYNHQEFFLDCRTSE